MRQTAATRPVNRRQRGALALKFLAAAGALLALLVLWFPSPLRAQVATADLLGSVTDASGAVVPGAKVTAFNTGTGITSAMKSGSTGEYLFSKLQIGAYKVTVEAKGFKTFVVDGITLNVGDRTRIDARLEIGSSVETVQVQASAAAQLQTDTSEISSLVSAKSISEMPTNGRNYYNLLGLEAGTNTYSLTDPRDGRVGMAFSANGQSSQYNNNLIDGMDNNERIIGEVAVEPSLDASQEVKVDTSMYSAEYSRTGGGIANLITKSGTNKFSGTLFEFMRNDAFDAYQWEPTGTAKSKTELRQNQFGGSLGGPILKNKAFFFGDYQGYRNVTGSISQSMVPNLAEYNSIHSAASAGSGTIALSDVWAYGGSVATNTLSPEIDVPYGSINPLGRAYVMEAPKPTCDPQLENGTGYTCNPTGGNTYNYSGPSKNFVNTDTIDARIDYHYNDTNQIFGRYSYNRAPNGMLEGNWPDTHIVPGNSLIYKPGNNQGLTIVHNAALDFIHIFSPQTLIEGKASYNQMFFTGFDGNNGTWTLDNLGIGCSTNFCYNTSGVYALPFLGSSSANFGTQYYGATDPYGFSGDVGGSYYTENSFQYNAALNMNRHTHSIKVGLTLIRRQIKAPETSRDTITWTPQNYGNALADMLYGDATAISGYKVMVIPHYRMWEPSAYVQDDWRVTPALTLNLGVRYDIYTPWTDRYGDISNFNTKTDLIVSPDLLGDNWSTPTANIATDFGDVSPRIGFAWSLNSDNIVLKNMVLRGGFGLSYFPGNTAGGGAVGGQFQLTNNPFEWTMGCGDSQDGYTTSPSCANQSYASAYALPNGGFNVGHNMPIATYNLALATDPTTYASTFSAPEYFISPNFKPLYLEQFSLQLQKQVGNNIATAGFVGNLSRRLPVEQDLNQPTIAPAAGGTYPLEYSSAYSYMQGTEVTTTFSGANSQWLAGEATYERRMSHGASASVNYTWSRTEGPGTGQSKCVYAGCLMDTGSGSAVPISGWAAYNYQGETSNRIAGMATYNIPFGQSLRGILGAAAKGWELNGTGYWQTGGWSAITYGGNSYGISTGTEHPSLVPGAKVKLAHPTLGEWFNTSAFQRPTYQYYSSGTGPMATAYYALGNANGPLVQGPRSRDLDLGLGKTFSLVEGFKLQFRAESFNVFNIPNYAGGSSGGGPPGGGGGGTYSISAYNPDGTINMNASSGFGAITSVSSQPRIFQFGVKLIY